LGLKAINTWAGDESRSPRGQEKNPFIRNMAGYYPPWVKIFTSDRKVNEKDHEKLKACEVRSVIRLKQIFMILMLDNRIVFGAVVPDSI